MTIIRITTGVPGLDELLQGGFPKGSIILVSGMPGTGKTLFGMHFIYEGAKNDQRSLYVTLDERIEKLILEAETIGIKLRNFIDAGKIEFLYLDVEKEEDFIETITKKVREGNFERMVIDSISALCETPIFLRELEESHKFAKLLDTMIPVPLDAPLVTRMHITTIINELRGLNCTSILISELIDESKGLSRDTITEFLVDGVIILTLDETMDIRKMKIRKMRGTKHTLTPQSIEITSQGLRIKKDVI